MMGMNRGADPRGGIAQAIGRGQPQRGGVGGIADRFRQTQQQQGRMARPAVMPPGPGGRQQLPMQGGMGGRMAQQQALAQRMRGGGRPRPNPTGNRMPMRGGGRMY